MSEDGALAHLDAKSRLTRFLQRKIKRTLTKEDFSFTIDKYEEGCQATLLLTCLGDGMEFVGEVGKDPKEAEQLAAAQAIESYAEVLQAMESEPPLPKRQRKAEAAVSRPTEAVGNAMDNPKGRLNAFLLKFVRRPLVKDDFMYETTKYEEGFQATLTLACLEGDVFVGEVAASSKDAEKNAAQIALEAYHDQVVEVESQSAPRKGRQDEVKGKGKLISSKGDAKGDFKGDMTRKGSMPKGNGAKGGCIHPPVHTPHKGKWDMSQGKGDGKWDMSQGKGGYGKWQGAYGPSPMLMPMPHPYMACKGGWRPMADPYAYGMPVMMPMPMYGKGMPKGNHAMVGKGVAAASRAQPAARKVAPPTPEVSRVTVQEKFKSQLNTFLQRYLGRPVVKGDMDCENEKLEEDRFQAKLTLHCVNNEVYTAEAETEKEAVELAAKSALEEHAAEVEALQPAEKKRRKPKDFAGEIGGASVNQIPLGGQGEQNDLREEAGKLASISNKSDLNMLVMKLARRTINKGEISYESSQVSEGTKDRTSPILYQSVLTIACVSGPDGENMWTGEVCENKQRAEHSAAGIAYEILMEMPENIASLQEREEMRAAERIEKMKNKGPEKGKGKGKEGMAD